MEKVPALERMVSAKETFDVGEADTESLQAIGAVGVEERPEVKEHLEQPFSQSSQPDTVNTLQDDDIEWTLWDSLTFGRQLTEGHGLESLEQLGEGPLEGKQHAEFLKVSGHSVSGQMGLSALAKAIKSMPNLRGLSLSFIPLRWQDFNGSDTLGQALSGLTGLRTLDLSHTSFDGDLHNSGFAELMHQLTGLSLLKLDGVKLEVGDVSTLLDAMAKKEDSWRVSFNSTNLKLRELEEIADTLLDTPVGRISGFVGSVYDGIRSGGKHIEVDFLQFKSFSTEKGLFSEYIRKYGSNIETAKVAFMSDPKAQPHIPGLWGRKEIARFLESLTSLRSLELRFTHCETVDAVIEMVEFVSGTSLRLKSLKLGSHSEFPGETYFGSTTSRSESLLAVIEKHVELVGLDFQWPSKAFEAEIGRALERNEHLQGLWTSAEDGDLELGDALWGKVFVCGDAYSGKTTLTKSLVSPGGLGKTCCYLACFPRTSPYEATRGIALARYQRDGTQLVIWDLAGQKEYQVLHCSLLADEGKATSYILVCRFGGDRQKDGVRGPLGDPFLRVRWWLELLASYTQPGSKRTVVLVFNEDGDQRAQRSALKRFVDELRVEYSDKLEVHAQPFFLDARHESSAGLRELRSELVRLTHSASKPAPKICLELQGRLAKWRKKAGRFPVQTWGEFMEFMGRGVSEDLLKGTTAYLHEMGEVVYFRSGALTGTVVSDPDLFCSKFVGELLLPEYLWDPQDRGLRNDLKHGVLSIDSLTGMFQEELHGSDWSTEQVVEILRGLELCDWVDDAKGEVLIPALLESSTEAIDSWHGRESLEPVLGRRLSCGPEAGTVLPPGVFKVLQVRLRKKYNTEDSQFSIDWASVSFLVDGVALLVHFDSAKAYQLSIVAKVVDERRRAVDALDWVEELCKEVYLICAEKGVRNEHVLERVLGGGSELEGLHEMGLEHVKEKVKRDGEAGLSGWEATKGRLLRYSELLTTAETEGIVGELRGARADEVEFARDVLGDDIFLGVREVVSELPDDTAAEFDGEKGLRKLVVRSTEIILKAGREGVRTFLEVGEHRHAALMAAIEDLRKGQNALLKQVVQQGHFLRSHARVPHFMYVADERGRFAKLRDVLSRTATLHLLCEGGQVPHVVVGQPGKTFKVTREWAQKAGPYLRWSLKLLIVVAKIGANVAAPGLDKLIPDLATELFSSQEGEKMRQILSKSVGTTLAKEVATFADDVGKWTDEELGRQAVVTGKERSLQESLPFLLEKVGATSEGELNVSFKLAKVEVQRAYAGKEPGQVVWVCEQCRKDLGPALVKATGGA